MNCVNRRTHGLLTLLHFTENHKCVHKVLVCLTIVAVARVLPNPSLLLQ